MKHALRLIALTLTTTAAVEAGTSGAPSAKDLDKAVQQVNYVETAKTGISLSGYVDAGYVYNFIGATSSPSTTGYEADNVSKGDFSLNAVKLVLEKPLTDANELQAGFRVDAMLGEDAAGLTEGNDEDSDSLYLQQGFVVVRAPWGNGLDIQIGKMNAILGFEADERPANLNITQGLNAALDPGPSAGVLFTYPATDLVTLTAGVNNGNGQSTNTGLDTDSDGYAFVGALGLTNPGGNAETQAAFHVAPWGDSGAGSSENEPVAGLNWWGTWAPVCLKDRTLFGFNTSLWMGRDLSAPGDPATDDASTLFTAALYAKHQITDIFSLAGRLEYTHTDDDQFLGLAPEGRAALSNDVLGWTLTAGFDLLENLMLRAEYRVDLGCDVVSSNGGDFNDDQAHTLATQVVYSF